MNILKRTLADSISKYALKKGIEINIDDISFKKGLTFKNASIQLCSAKAFIKSLHLKIEIKALFRKRIDLDVACKDATITCEHLSDKDFNIEMIECNVSCDKHLKNISCDAILSQKIPLSFKVIRNSNSSDFFIKAEHLSIDKYKWLFSEHILSHFMRTIYSDSSITILCYYKYDNESPYPKLSSIFQYDSLTVYPNNYIISKDYIINELSRCNHLAKDYKRYEEISEIIRRTVICTEDPSFELHKGISPILMGLTLRANINQKALGRGGSTISMQLIKNALLNGKRTMCRKIEETILTLLMENYYHVSKHDILEIYLNMIEFAPNIYGIEDAAKFYFFKPSSELNIVEIIVLTYIIPRPIHFYEALLQKTEQLRINLNNHIKQHLNVALQKKIITQECLNSIGTDYITFADEFGTLSLKL